MDSLTDERNSWFNAIRLEDSHDYSSAALAYLEDANRCLGRGLYVRAAMSATSAASCLATASDIRDAVDLYSAAATVYELNADISMERSIRESLWSLIHAFEYFTLISDHVNAERVAKKYADIARRIDRFEAPAVFETLKNRRENVLVARSNLGSPAKGLSPKDFPDLSRIQRSTRTFLQQVQTVALTSDVGDLDSEIGENVDVAEDEHLVYQSESDLVERRLVS
jgi:hypothetical protein